MRPLQISETAILSKVQGKRTRRVFTSDAGVASMALVDVIEEASQGPGQHLMVVVVLDEVVPGVTDTCAVEQGASGEAVEDLDNVIIREAG
jgi:hypothetical protein